MNSTLPYSSGDVLRSLLCQRQELSVIHKLTSTIVAATAIAATSLAVRGQTTTPSSGVQQAAAEWRDWAGSPEGNRYVALNQITKENVSKLSVAWSYPYGQTGVNPLVARGTIYTAARNNAIVALDAATGREIWIHDGLTGMTRRGLNYWESADGTDRRIIYALGDYLQEIDANTGKSIPTFGIDGGVDLRQGLGRDPNMIHVQSNTPGKVFENLILVGSAPGETYFSAPGDLRAYNVVTGKLAWQFHTLPHPDEYGYDTWPKDSWKYTGAANTWGEISIDSKRGIAYFPTGSPNYDFYGADRPGAGLFGNSLVALDARTGKRVWHFQNVHHDLWDYDNVATPQLTTITQNGRQIDVVALAGKTGFLYVFNRVTGQPIWPIEERKVPVSHVPGEVSYPTQPFPTAPPPFARQKFTVDDVNPYILTPERRAELKAQVAQARNEGLFTPIGLEDIIDMPGHHGGANWGMTSANPNDGSVYVISFNGLAVMKVGPPDPAAVLGGGGRGRQGAAPANFPPGPVVQSGPAVVRQGPAGRGGSMADYPEGVDHPPSRYENISPSWGLNPEFAGPPYTTLTAYDLNKGAIQWQVGLGDDYRVVTAGGPKGTGGAEFLKSSVIVTSTGLLFVNAADRKVHIYDKENGKELHELKLGGSSSGGPSMYEVQGRQYLLVTAGGGGGIGSQGNAADPNQTGPTGLIAYALPQ